MAEYAMNQSKDADAHVAETILNYTKIIFLCDFLGYCWYIGVTFHWIFTIVRRNSLLSQQVYSELVVFCRILVVFM
jgi:hypothetical protein